MSPWGGDIMKIVMLENYVASREVYYYHLSDQGYRIDVYCEPSEETISKIVADIESEEDLILLIDYKMPIMNGLEVIERLKEASSKLKLDNTYIVTNYPRLVNVDKLNSVGCRLIQKPVKLEDIDRFISEVSAGLSRLKSVAFQRDDQPVDQVAPIDLLKQNPNQ